MNGNDPYTVPLENVRQSRNNCPRPSPRPKVSACPTRPKPTNVCPTKPKLTTCPRPAPKPLCPRAPGSPPRVKFIHAIAGGPPVDVYINGGMVKRFLNYSDVSKYYQLTAGSYQFSVVQSGNGCAKLFQDVVQSVGPTDSFTIIVLRDKDTGLPTAVMLRDNLFRPLAGNAHVRFFHAAYAAPKVDVYMNNAMMFEDVEYESVGRPKDDPTAQYLQFPATDYQLDIDVADIKNTILDSQRVALEPDRVYTIVAIGRADDSRYPLDALVSFER